MIRLTMLAVSSVLVLGTVPLHAEDLGRQMNGEAVHRDHYWREHERERAYRHEPHRSNAEQRELDARRRAMHDEHRSHEENGFYGR